MSQVRGMTCGKTHTHDLSWVTQPMSFPKQAIEHFLSSLLNRDLVRYQMAEQEWVVLQDFKMILLVCSYNYSNGHPALSVVYPIPGPTHGLTGHVH
jgi:hypothetical protein